MSWLVARNSRRCSRLQSILWPLLFQFVLGSEDSGKEASPKTSANGHVLLREHGTKASHEDPKTNKNDLFRVAIQSDKGNENVALRAIDTSTRQLQSTDGIQCVPVGGSAFCLWDGFPFNDYAGMFYGCPAGTTSPLQCNECGVFQAEDYGSVFNMTALPQCTSCEICNNSVAFDCSNLLTGTCVGRDCSGDCIDNSAGPIPTPSPETTPPTPQATPSPSVGNDAFPNLDTDFDCAALGPTTELCVLYNHPATGFVSSFLGCPIDTTSPLQCELCSIWSYGASTSEQCSLCQICPTTGRLAYDCSNIQDTAGICKIQDCNGVCQNDSVGPPATSSPTMTQTTVPATEAPTSQTDPPTPEPTTQTDPPTPEPTTQTSPPTPESPPGSTGGPFDLDCARLDPTNEACILDSFPFNGYAGVLLGCPADTTSPFQCNWCGIFEAEDYESSFDLIVRPMCTSCTLCPSSGNVAYDCSNRISSGSCVKRDCNGVCTASP